MKLLRITFLIIGATIITSSYGQNITDMSQDGVRRISAMVTDTVKNILYVAGDISKMNGVKCRNVIQFDGKNWSPVGDGVDFSRLYFGQLGMIMHKGNLFLYTPSIIAMWDGKVWKQIDNIDPKTKKSIFHFITSMTVYKDELYIATGLKDGFGVFKFDGSSFSNQIGELFDDKIYSLSVFNDELYAAGGFRKCGSQNMFLISRLRANKWTTVNNDELEVPGTTMGTQSVESKIGKMQVFKGELYASGGSVTVKGAKEKGQHNIKWDGKRWSVVELKEFEGFNYPAYGGWPAISEFIVYKHELYALSIWRESMMDSSPYAFLKLKGDTWEPVFTAGGPHPFEAMAVFKNEVYFGGYQLGKIDDVKTKTVFKYSPNE